MLPPITPRPMNPSLAIQQFPSAYKAVLMNSLAAQNL
jgi:hypothetical protein